MSLHPCPGCRRHARAAERCPFCGEMQAPAPPSAGWPLGVSRAALVALGASLALEGCDRTPVGPSVSPAYGAAPPVSAQGPQKTPVAK